MLWRAAGRVRGKDVTVNCVGYSGDVLRVQTCSKDQIFSTDRKLFNYIFYTLSIVAGLDYRTEFLTMYLKHISHGRRQIKSPAISY